MKRALSIVLVLAMLLTAMLGIVSSAEESAPVLSISGANIEFGNNVYLYVAVDYSVLGTSDGVALKVTNTVTGEEKILERNSSVESTEGFPAGSVGFKLDGIAAKNMGDELTLTPMNGGVEVKEAAKSYSILEYALRAENRGDAILAALVQAMISYGAEAQKSLGHVGTYDLSVDHSLVRLMGGAKFENGETKAIMKAGDAPLTATKAGATADSVWYNSRVQTKGTGATLSVGYTEDNQSLFVGSALSANEQGAQVDYEIQDASIPNGVWAEKREDGTLRWWQMVDGNVVEYTGSKKPDGTLNFHPGTQLVFDKENGYVEMTTFSNTNYTDNTTASAYYFNNTTYKNGATIADAAKDPGVKAFTISFTIACGDASARMFDVFALRYKGSGAYYMKSGKLTAFPNTTYMGSNIPLLDSAGNPYTGTPYGRLAVLGGSMAGGTLSTYLGTDGSYVKDNPKREVLATTYDFDGNLRTRGEFVTVHSVFVFETETEGMRIDYYLNDDPTCVASVDIGFMERADFTNGQWYIDHTAYAANTEVFFKSIAITGGNIADNFK